MITQHVISLWHQLPDDSEVELKATVSHVRGTRNDLEVVWDDASQLVLDDMSRDEQKDYDNRAEVAWYDTMEKLDQDTEADEAADHHMAVCKERREEGFSY